MSGDYSGLANALDKLAAEVENNAGRVVGSYVSVEAKPGFTGSVIGEHISVSVGPGTHGPVIGKKVTVVAGGGNTCSSDRALAGEIRAVATQLREGKADRSLIQKVINGAGQLGSAAVTAVSRGVAQALLDQAGG
jgi:hypothetical protein